MTKGPDDTDRTWLDRLAARVEAPQAPAALTARILADFDRRAARLSLGGLLRRAADAVWPGAPLWQPACAFALSLMVGLGVAALAPLDVAQADQPGAFALDAPADLDVGQDT